MKALAMRFAAVGVVNTALDFSIFVLLSAFGVPVLVANLISTSIGLAFSFFANRRFAFRATTSSHQTLLFFVTTGIGLWGLQPAIMLAAIPALTPLVGVAVAASLAKIIAIGFTATCNFFVYSRAVFRTPDGRTAAVPPMA